MSIDYPPTPHPYRDYRAPWTLFCRVVDNYGDIGVCWRLATQLADEYHKAITLWVDDLSALKKLRPETDINADCQTLRSATSTITIVHWRAGVLAGQHSVGEVVIEAFACDIPSWFIQRMAHTSPPPHWINLEYLSAESWIEDCHKKTSTLLVDGVMLKKIFYFPGFTEKTGGLIREKDLIHRRDAFINNPLHWPMLLKILNLSALAPFINNPHHHTISLFCYRHAPIKRLFNALKAKPTMHWHIFVAEGQPRMAIEDAYRINLSPPSNTAQAVPLYPNVSLYPIAFVSQDTYDQLLWACDINVVRGEDSFVRAQWAAKPFIWHIYPQDKNAHLKKLEAFIALSQLPPCLANLWRLWNDQAEHSAPDINRRFQEYWYSVVNNQMSHMDIKAFGVRWQEILCKQPSLAQRLTALTDPISPTEC